jgi:hypothetical protein
MANSNFVVHNGLTVGPLTIDAATGTVSTTGALGTNYLNSSQSTFPGNTGNIDYMVNGGVESYVGANVDPFGASLSTLTWYDCMNPNNVLVTLELGSNSSI